MDRPTLAELCANHRAALRHLGNHNEEDEAIERVVKTGLALVGRVMADAHKDT